jgi:O-antigen chain-terminating methyltransferase
VSDNSDPIHISLLNDVFEQRAPSCFGSLGNLLNSFMRLLRRHLSARQEAINDDHRRSINLLIEDRERLRLDLRATSAKLDELIERFKARPYMTQPIYPLEKNDGSRKPQRQLETSFDYVGFENIFRGDEQMIKGRQSVYVDLFRACTSVVDVGCGRGEFLELLRDASIPAIGIDTNEEMVRHCKEKGLENTFIVDFVDFFDAKANGELDGIFSAQFIEHLPLQQLNDFLVKSRQKLAPHGLLVAETVNPHSIEALKTFYVDLTHVKPLFPEVMLFMARSAGYSDAKIFYPNGKGFEERDEWKQHEYALVCWK